MFQILCLQQSHLVILLILVEQVHTGLVYVAGVVHPSSGVCAHKHQNVCVHILSVRVV